MKRNLLQLFIATVVMSSSTMPHARSHEEENTKMMRKIDPHADLYPETIPHPSVDENLLGLRLWVIETIPKDREVIQATMEAHIRYQLMLEREGIMFAAGPIYEAEAIKPDGNGLIVIRAETLSDARRIADNDPMHKSGGRTYRLRQWRVNEGSFTVTVPFSRYHSPEIK
jgi:uncharacterized protein YciI